MAANDIWLGISGSEILLSAYGRKYKRIPDAIVRQDRTASGRLVKDIVTTKYNHTISYEICTDFDVRIFQTIYDYDSTLNLLVREVTGIKTYSVLMKPFERERVTAVGDGLWSGVTIELEGV
jgi:hypothetical protein